MPGSAVSILLAKPLPAGATATVEHGQFVGGLRIVALPAGAQHVCLAFADVRVAPGAFPTRVTICLDPAPAASGQTPAAITFFVRDVTSQCPILVIAAGIAVIPAADTRTFAQLVDDVHAKGGLSQHQRIARAPETTLDAAMAGTRDQPCPTWLGVGRDVRIFRISPQTDGPAGHLGYWGKVEPWNHSLPRDIPENRGAIAYTFVVGRGAMCAIQISRRLHDGCLPILESIQRDGDIEYHLTAFATLERSPLALGNVRGTHPVAALANTLGAMLTKQELALYDDQLRQREIVAREEELVCWIHVRAVNIGASACYAYLQVAGQSGARTAYDPATGITRNEAGDALAVSLLNGSPAPQREMAILLQPNAELKADLLFPHRPVEALRAVALARQSYTQHFDACRLYWQSKLESAATIELPEQAVTDRVKAGLLHLDINTLGLSDSGHLLATVGWYSPIGSESSPVIQFFDSMGWHELAERSIQFFLDRQRPDGFIQTFSGYQLETGPALWTIGEHFRYTRNLSWAQRIRDKVFAACRYVLAWRKRNMRDELRGRGYGLLDGKVADPEDFFHSFMLNGLAYLGLKRIAEMYRDIAPQEASELALELPGYLRDIRIAYAQSVASSPVVPIGDGTWLPSFAPWAEYPGPVSLFAEGGDWFSHGIFACRDTLIGALYLAIGEVLDPHEPMAEWLVRVHQELMTYRNAGMSQPYYCRHDWLHLKRGEVKEFLAIWYTQFAALQDRETYTFWEHYYGVSQHKTHEEGWFLMQTRWMLWHEDHATGTLHLLSMIPRNWLDNGKHIRLRNCVSHFGIFDLSVSSETSHGCIRAELALHSPSLLPGRISLRLPHPSHRCPARVVGGEYDADTEAVVIANPGTQSDVVLHFAL